MKKKSDNKSCKNGCEKYSRSMDDIVKYATKDLITLKEIADEQKIKISCLRKHRNELQDKMEEREAENEAEFREQSAEPREKAADALKLKDENSCLKKQVQDQKGEIESKIKEIEIANSKSTDLISSSNSLADELSLIEMKKFIDRKKREKMLNFIANN